jgi:hypothetical protein
MMGAIIDNPVMLFYRMSLNYDPNKYAYEAKDQEMVFDNEEEEAQFKKDQELAKKLQDEFDGKSLN